MCCAAAAQLFNSFSLSRGISCFSFSLSRGTLLVFWGGFLWCLGWKNCRAEQSRAEQAVGWSPEDSGMLSLQSFSSPHSFCFSILCGAESVCFSLCLPPTPQDEGQAPLGRWMYLCLVKNRCNSLHFYYSKYF